MKGWSYLTHRAVLCLICLLALALFGSDHPFARAQTDERLVKTPAELEAAIADAEPGDVILMQDGVWKDIRRLRYTTGNRTIRQEKAVIIRAKTFQFPIIHLSFSASVMRILN
ncbi:hypothetical protein FE783_35580 [Paenibacillus mesophilus]|nr:hypothetical protein FE783_35580 [Paenibacillus mesophilus]